MRHLFLKLDTNVLVLLLICALGPPTPLSILVRASLRCSVKGVVHSIVQDLQFLGNFPHGIAGIVSEGISLFLAIESGIEPTNADALDKKASLIRTTVYSSANIIAKWFSNGQLAF